MTVIANLTTGVWALVGPKFFKIIPGGQAEAALKIARQDARVAVTDAEWNAIQALVA